jgi:hypothetical protein
MSYLAVTLLGFKFSGTMGLIVVIGAVVVLAVLYDAWRRR